MKGQSYFSYTYGKRNISREMMSPNEVETGSNDRNRAILTRKVLTVYEPCSREEHREHDPPN